MKKVIERGNWEIKGGYCKHCINYFGIVNFASIDYCPYCGSKNITVPTYTDRNKIPTLDISLSEDLICMIKEPETPSEIVDKIKEIYHSNRERDLAESNQDEEEMEKLLYKLKDLAEKHD
ncbi:MAG: hypothetical protein PVJ67_04045 [Candidatus Pacearchaeota archaeon]|jgi:hypothetical protein